MTFAAFAVVVFDDGSIAATTRDKGNSIGLPGGKVDLGETPEEAVIREAEEEGWLVCGLPVLIRQDYVEGKLVAWYAFEEGFSLENYKEKPRGIRPIRVSLAEMANSGYGNDFLKDYKK